MADKTCKVYPRNGAQFISGILYRRKRIEYPCKINLNQAELRRCLSYATVYEEVNGKDVLLTLDNFTADNSDAKAATDVPEGELNDYTTEEESGEKEEEPTTQPEKVETPVQAKAQAPKATQVKTPSETVHTFKEDGEEESDI